MLTIVRWAKTFKTRKISEEDDTHSGRPKTSVTQANNTLCKSYGETGCVIVGISQ